MRRFWQALSNGSGGSGVRFKEGSGGSGNLCTGYANIPSSFVEPKRAWAVGSITCAYSSRRETTELHFSKKRLTNPHIRARACNWRPCYLLVEHIVCCHSQKATRIHGVLLFLLSDFLVDNCMARGMASLSRQKVPDVSVLVGLASPKYALGIAPFQHFPVPECSLLEGGRHG